MDLTLQLLLLQLPSNDFLLCLLESEEHLKKHVPKDRRRVNVLYGLDHLGRVLFFYECREDVL